MSGLHDFLSNPQDGDRRPRTALVVDSDFGSVHTLAQALRQEGLDVFEATSFQEGKFLWSTQSPDILIVDIRLGQFNGLQRLMRARSDRPDILAFITSSFADPVLEAETRRFGGLFMIKPVDPGVMVKALRTNGTAVEAQASNLLERRKADRRVVHAPDFLSDRRVEGHRHLEAGLDRRAADRRQGGVAGPSPERRKGERRTPTRPPG
jgi:DNA-binding response OmpR family regulator